MLYDIHKKNQDKILKHTTEDNGSIESFHSSTKTDYICPNKFADIYKAGKMVEYMKFLASAKRKTEKFENKIKEVEVNGI